MALDLVMVVEEEAPDAEEFLATQGLLLPVLYDDRGEVGRFYEVHAVPCAVLVDESGTEIARLEGLATLDGLIALTREAL